jgi:transcriptional regulator with XRE-family HTH domain
MGRCPWRERLLAGLSREDLGDWLGIGAEAVRQYEYGEDRMSPPELALIARRLGVPLSFFCSIDEESAAPPEPEAMEQVRRLSARRSLSLLSTPAFAGAGPLFEIWQAGRGELSEDLFRVAHASGAFGRMIVVHNPAGGARLITRHYGAGIKTMRPCKYLLTVDRDFYEHHPDRDYATWVAKAYA